MGFIEEIKNKEGKVVSFKAIPYVNGKKVLRKNFDSRRDAQRYIESIELGIPIQGEEALERIVRVEAPIPPKVVYPTLREAFEQFKERSDLKGSKNFKHVLYQLEYWLKVAGNMPLDQITPLFVTQEKEKLKLIKRTFATVDRYIKALYSLYRWAKRVNGLNLSNLTTPRADYTPEEHRLAIPLRGDEAYLKKEDQENLLKVAKNYNKNKPMYYIFVRLLLETGCRSSEINQARKSWLDLEQGILTVPLEFTKTKKQPRVAYINPAFLPELREYVKSNNSEFLFPSPYEDRPILLNATMRKIFNRAGLKNNRLHDLRHTFCSNLINFADAEIYEVKEAVGHTNIQTTLRYVHLLKEKKKAVVNKLFTNIDLGV